MSSKSSDDLFYLAVIVGAVGLYYYLRPKSKENFFITNFNTPLNSNTGFGRPTIAKKEENVGKNDYSPEDLIDYYDNNYHFYDDFNVYAGQEGRLLEDINQLFIPTNTEGKPNPGDNPDRYVNAVNLAGKKGASPTPDSPWDNKHSAVPLDNNSKKSILDAGEEFLIDEYDDPVDKINSYRFNTRDGKMGNMQDIKISDLYDYMTKGKTLSKKAVKQPLIDPVTNEPVYLSESKNLEKTVKPDMWMYEREHENNGGHMGNNLFGYDAQDGVNAVYQSPFPRNYKTSITDY